MAEVKSKSYEVRSTIDTTAKNVAFSSRVHLMKAGIPLEGASDHGVSEALYLRDPDDNGVELYWDRPREEWPRTAEGGLAMFSRSLDLDSLLK
jgi:catechol-2,3-dioxygenase